MEGNKGIRGENKGFINNYKGENNDCLVANCNTYIIPFISLLVCKWSLLDFGGVF